MVLRVSRILSSVLLLSKMASWHLLWRQSCSASLVDDVSGSFLEVLILSFLEDFLTSKGSAINHGYVMDDMSPAVYVIPGQLNNF